MPAVTLESLHREVVLNNRKLDLLLNVFLPGAQLITPATASRLLGISKSSFNELIKQNPEWLSKQAKGHKKIYRVMVEEYCKSKGNIS